MKEHRIVEMPIIPVGQNFAPRPGSSALHYEAMAVYSCLGFFLGADTYFHNKQVLQPGHRYILDSDGSIISGDRHFSWHHSPRDVGFKQVVEEFAHLFEQIVGEQTRGKKVILPLSGGLDSRTQAAGLRSRVGSVTSYSYEFENGIPETRYGELIAKHSGFPFRKMSVGKGYLWSCIEDLAELNDCYSEFTHPRQMTFLDQYAAMGDVFSLGHWGDVLFDDMRVSGTLSGEEQIRALKNKVIKPGGIELANALWEAWGLKGKFEEYLTERLTELYDAIHIDDANARIRAFKSLYWAPRWTSVNLKVFSSVRPVTLPYYDDRMCQFICGLPEQWLAGRKIQIAYLKMTAPQLSKLPWQSHAPFNLYNYQWNKLPWNLPIRLWKKAVGISRRMGGKQRLIQRNWELQFLGHENDLSLRHWLFGNKALQELIPLPVVEEFYEKFTTGDSRRYSHAVTMLLTLSLFAHRQKTDPK